LESIPIMGNNQRVCETNGRVLRKLCRKWTLYDNYCVLPALFVLLINVLTSV